MSLPCFNTLLLFSVDKQLSISLANLAFQFIARPHIKMDQTFDA